MNSNEILDALTQLKERFALVTAQFEKDKAEYNTRHEALIIDLSVAREREERKEREERELREKLERERVERERIEREQAERLERERIELEKFLEQARLEQIERERLAQIELERVERERVARVAQIERERVERERVAKAERERIEFERQAREQFERVERERQAQIERERLAQLERERVVAPTVRHFRSNVCGRLGDAIRSLDIPAEIRDQHLRWIENTDDNDNGHREYVIGNKRYILHNTRKLHLFKHECFVDVSIITQ